MVAEPRSAAVAVIRVQVREGADGDEAVARVLTCDELGQVSWEVRRYGDQGEVLAHVSDWLAEIWPPPRGG